MDDKDKDEYRAFLESKRVAVQPCGLASVPPLHPALFKHQRIAVDFLLRLGRGAAFLDTGLGKTLIQLEWARHVPGNVLILAPLAVSPQTVREAKQRLGLEVVESRDGKRHGKITITNYEQLDHVNPAEYTGVVLDESSILKSFMGKTKSALITAFAQTPYRLCCTATPAPNDYMELGNHADFLGVMPSNEMLSRFFINDTMNFGQYRLKGHSVKDFWRWVASWAVCMTHPRDFGIEDTRYDLPPLNMTRHIVDRDADAKVDDGFLFAMPGISATDLHREKRASLHGRVKTVCGLVGNGEPWIVWCESNAESEALAAAIPDAVEVKGSQSCEVKEARIDSFSRGESRVIITKPSIAGFGLNWQHVNNVCFASLSFSFENFYQAIRRTWRFGQQRTVNVHTLISPQESGVWAAVERKMNNHQTMHAGLREAAKMFKDSMQHQIKEPYQPKHKGSLPSWIQTKET